MDRAIQWSPSLCPSAVVDVCLQHENGSYDRTKHLAIAHTVHGRKVLV